MFVIERSRLDDKADIEVAWDERFYSGHNYINNVPTWGPLDHAVEYHNKSRAISMSYRIDDEAGYGNMSNQSGFTTTVEALEDYDDV